MSWAQRSVWTAVCAMELGVFSESCLKGISFGPLSDDANRGEANVGRSRGCSSTSSPILSDGCQEKKLATRDEYLELAPYSKSPQSAFSPIKKPSRRGSSEILATLQSTGRHGKDRATTHPANLVSRRARRKSKKKKGERSLKSERQESRARTGCRGLGRIKGGSLGQRDVWTEATGYRAKLYGATEGIEDTFVRSDEIASVSCSVDETGIVGRDILKAYHQTDNGRAKDSSKSESTSLDEDNDRTDDSFNILIDRDSVDSRNVSSENSTDCNLSDSYSTALSKMCIDDTRRLEEKNLGPIEFSTLRSPLERHPDNNFDDVHELPLSKRSKRPVRHRGRSHFYSRTGRAKIKDRSKKSSSQTCGTKNGTAREEFESLDIEEKEEYSCSTPQDISQLNGQHRSEKDSWSARDAAPPTKNCILERRVYAKPRTNRIAGHVLEAKTARKLSEGKSGNLREDSPRKDSSTPHEPVRWIHARRITRGSTRINKENFLGKLVWGFCSGWWPALIIEAEHAGMVSEQGKLWVFWIGESRISLLNEKTQIESFSCNLESRLAQNINADARMQAIDATMQMLRERLGCNLTRPYYAWIRKNVSALDGSLDEMKFYPYPPKIQRRLNYLKEKNMKTTEKYVLSQKRTPDQMKKQPVERHKEGAQRKSPDLTRLSLEEQNPGVITWAKITGHNWWPAMIMDYRDCCMQEPSFGCQWIIWYGDYKLSQVHHSLFLKFDKGMEKMRDYTYRTKKHLYLIGVLQASKDYCSRLGCKTDDWTLEDAFQYFSKRRNDLKSNTLPNSMDSSKIYNKYSPRIVGNLNEFKMNSDIDDKRKREIKHSDDLRSVKSGELSWERLCLRCLEASDDEMEKHPFFEGSLCKKCSGIFKPCMFVYGNDGKCFYCTICAGTGTVVICDRDDCPRVYCTACLKYLMCPKSYDEMLLEDPWECFLCKRETDPLVDTPIVPRSDWKEKMSSIFRTAPDSSADGAKGYYSEKRKIRVLSLFDGLSTGLLVLLRLGIAVDVYYASEIDEDALMVSTSHFGDRVTHLGNVKDITRQRIKEITPIDLLIGGSPCNDLSLANPARLGLHDPNGTGILFFEYCRIMKLVKQANKGHHLFWLYENVASMPTEYRLEINKHLGQEPDVIDSADFSPQHRLRLYWHNLPIEPHSLTFQDQQDVQDILTPNCQRYALVKKIRTVTTKVNSLKQGKLALKPILMENKSDSLWITELEEIFGFPRHYTDVKNLSATKRQKLIGKSWSVQTLSAILRSLCSIFTCNEKLAHTP
ncbi:hypothetical protein KM043_000904 [Ampulex compressa]|nr:hypothetical protein KM043_000904 [Ampulex compressa]